MSDKYLTEKSFYNPVLNSDGSMTSDFLTRAKKFRDQIKMFGYAATRGLEEYIDELKGYSQLQNKKIVSIDPGKCDLIYCVDADNKEANKFRYSQDQRRKETKKKKFSKIH